MPTGMAQSETILYNEGMGRGGKRETVGNPFEADNELFEEWRKVVW